MALSGIGEALAQARQTQGLALTDVAQQLKFAARHLEALEQERFESLPGATFARGMVRSYARLLKLDPEPLLARISGRLEVPDSSELAARYHQPVPFSDSGRRSTLLYLVLSIGVLGFVGLVAYQWHYETRQPRQAAAAISAPAAALMPPRTTPVQPASAPSEPVIVKVLQPPAKDLPPTAGTGGTEKSGQGGGRIVLRCERESWIEVKDAEGRLLISSLNPAGTERVVQGRPPFTLVIGNAQHVRVSYNDQPVDLQPHIKVEVARLTLR